MSDKVIKLAGELHEKTISTLNKLDDIWDEIGLDDETRLNRHQMFHDHVDELYNDMITEAELSKTNLLEQMQSIGKELFSLGRDLRMNISVDVAGYEKMPLYKAKEEMKDKLKRYQDVFNARKTEINNLIANQKALCKALGKKPRDLIVSPLPTQEEINEFQSYLEELSNLKFIREEEFFKLKSRIISIMDELKIKPSLDFERQVVVCEDSSFQVTDENMEQLRELHKSLEKQLHETKIKITELRERISNLWGRLEESPQVISEFLQTHQGNSIPTLIALKEEISKLEERKRANIKLFVDKLRQELSNWWDKCYFSQEDRENFIHFDSDCYTEDLLTLHEMEVEKMKRFYERNIAIFNMYNKRKQLWEKMIDLEQRANHPNRLRNRGGQLLNEEKERKSIRVQLPKIENELVSLVKDYEENNYKPFLIFGKSLLELLSEDWKEHQEEKKNKLSVKKKQRENTPNPSKSTLLHSHTPVAYTSKRKLFTTASEMSKKSRLEVSSTKSSSSSKVKSMDRQRRLEKIKKRSHAQKLNQNDTNYELFENGLETKPSCRSSLFSDRVLRSKNFEIPTFRLTSTNGTPRKILGVKNTPQKTPLKSGLRPKSPTFITPRLAAAPNNLPIII